MDRVKEINEISTTLNKSRAKFDQYLSKLGWDEQLLLKPDKSDYTNCTVKKEHYVPKSSLQQHVYKCQIKKEGQDPKEVCPSSHFFYKNSLAVVPVIIDKKTYEHFKEISKESQGEKVEFSKQDENSREISSASGSKKMSVDMPFTESASKSDLNSNARTMLYDYVIKTAKSIKRQAEQEEFGGLGHEPEEGDQQDTKNTRKSHLEELAEMRDYKRRRQSYRAKNVHMTKRSNVEVMRDLIETQMKVLQEQIEDNQ